MIDVAREEEQVRGTIEPPHERHGRMRSASELSERCAVRCSTGCVIFNWAGPNHLDEDKGHDWAASGLG
jgi:hypothetical protein